jgi:hypothetical protein
MESAGGASMSPLALATARYFVVILWPSPREPKWTPIQTKPSSSWNRST